MKFTRKLEAMSDVLCHTKINIESDRYASDGNIQILQPKLCNFHITVGGHPPLVFKSVEQAKIFIDIITGGR